MKVSHPHEEELTPEELEELEKLKGLITRATADGILTEYEIESIKHAIRADHKVTYAELNLIRELITNKITSGELRRDW